MFLIIKISFFKCILKNDSIIFRYAFIGYEMLLFNVSPIFQILDVSNEYITNIRLYIFIFNLFILEKLSFYKKII